MGHDEWLMSELDMPPSKQNKQQPWLNLAPATAPVPAPAKTSSKEETILDCI